ncbi:MAG: heme exporter protein CcmD [Chromatiales bacterium]|nr:MAG: heme exporter protein CcmD [Chromatiales bacterium]
MKEFLEMGGYAGYVWSSFGLTLIVLIANVVAARRRLANEITRARRRAMRPGAGGGI